MKRTIIAALLLSFIGLGACKKAENLINKTGNAGSLTATIDGYAYTAGTAYINVSSDGAELWIH